MDTELFRELSVFNGSLTPEQVKDKLQHAAWEKWRDAGKKGTIEAATGVGKSKIAVKAMMNLFNGHANPESNYVAYIVVPTETLRDIEWPAEIKKWWPRAPMDKIKIICHVSMDEVRENRPIKLAIFDEIHHITERNITFFENNIVEEVMGLSATVPTTSFPGSFDKAEAIKRLAPVIFRVSINEAKALKLVAEFEIILLKFALDTANLSVSYKGKDGKTIQTTEAARYLQMTKGLARSIYSKKSSAAWRFSQMQQRSDFVRNFPTKTKVAKNVLKELLSEGKRTLVFAGSIEQAGELCGDQVYHSKSGKEGKTQLKRFCNKEIDYLGAVMALNEGKNIPDVDQAFLVQISSQARDLIQRIGRTIRWRDGIIAKIIVLVAKDTVDEKWWKTASKGIDKKLITEYIIKPEV